MNNFPENSRIVLLYEWLNARRLLVLTILATLGFLVYYTSLSAPWYFDDVVNIVENPDLKLAKFDFSKLFSNRGIVWYTFVFNYHFFGDNVFVFHLTNLVIHISTAFIVYVICRNLGRGLSKYGLLIAVIFLIHPLQTQSVTYVVQRTNSLAGLFVFLSIFLYLKFSQRDFRLDVKGCLYYAAALLAGFVALKTKENAATLPVLILLVEYFLAAEGRFSWPRTLWVLPFFLAPLWAFMSVIVLPQVADTTHLGRVGNVQQISTQVEVGALKYFATQLSVLLVYVKLFFVPYGQALDYSYPYVDQVFTLKNCLLAFMHLAIVVSAIVFRKSLKLISFGVLWFYVALFVESSFIPLDPIFEHRMYVPLFGMTVLVVGVMQQLGGFYPFLLVLLLLLPLSILTMQRNALWSSPVAFYEDNLRRVPWSERVRTALAELYMRGGRSTEAARLLEEAIAINPLYQAAYVNLSKIYADNGQFQKAIKLLEQIPMFKQNSKEVLLNIGILKHLVGDDRVALAYLLRALAIDTRNPQIHLNLGLVYESMASYRDAITHYEHAIRLRPDYDKAYHNLGVVYYHLGEKGRAAELFMKSYSLNRRAANSLYNWAVIQVETGDVGAAESQLQVLRSLDQQLYLDLVRTLRESASP